MMYFVLIAPMPGWTRYTLVGQFDQLYEAQDWIKAKGQTDPVKYVVAEVLP